MQYFDEDNLSQRLVYSAWAVNEGAAIAIGIINFYPPLMTDQTYIFVLFLQNNTRISDYYRLDNTVSSRMVNRCRLRADA